MAASTREGARSPKSRSGNVRLRPELNDIPVMSMDDTQNVYAGIDYEDRMAILLAFNEVLPRLATTSPHDADLRRDYVLYVGLTMLLKLVRDTGARWGDGSLGSATPPAPHGPRSEDQRTGRRLPRRVVEARRPENLLLNMVRGILVLPQYKDLNFPIEVRNAKEELHRRCFSRGVFIQSSKLTAAVAIQLAQLARIEPLPKEEADRLANLATRGIPMGAPGLKIPVTQRTVPAALEYYGLARPARTSLCNGYYVQPWLVQSLVAMRESNGTIRLGDLEWMAGRYRLEGPRQKDASPGGTPRAQPGADPATPM